MMILESVDLLLLEIKRYSTLEKVFRYGALKTLSLAINRGLNHEVVNHFNSFLSRMDRVILLFDKEGYKPNINRVELGELYNITRTTTKNSTEFLEAYFNVLTRYVFEIVKLAIDYLFNNEQNIRSVNSIQSFLHIKNNDKLIKETKELLVEFRELLLNKPTSFLNIISDLKRVRLYNENIQKIISGLEKNIVYYIRTKYAVTNRREIIQVD